MTDIKKYTNDDKRREFFQEKNEDEGWYLWLEIGDINRKFMRCDIEDVSFIADMREQTFTYPNKHVSWSTHHWYIVSDWKKPFEDNVASLSMCIDQLKQIQKKTKK